MVCWKAGWLVALMAAKKVVHWAALLAEMKGLWWVEWTAGSMVWRLVDQMVA